MQEKVVGVNQSIKAIKKGIADYVYIAIDAEKHVIQDLENMCSENNIEIKYIDTMKKLGRMFNVQVKVAAVTIIKGGE